jgi:polyisoprenoid-binding protein YceI
MKTTHATALCALVGLGLALAGPLHAQQNNGLPPGVYVGEQDYKAAPAGAYALDPNHAAVIARVSHIGYSYSVFRFDKVAGDLTWDPAAPERSTLKVKVQTGSIATNVEGFAAQLSGANWLNAPAFPEATFVSTAFHQTDASHGRVEGQFTLLGKTRPLTFDVTLVGAGKGFMGQPRIGAHAEGAIDPKDYGLPPLLPAPILLVIDAEFEKAK